ncbi:MAG: TasA family protein [Sarcina sp.]
MMRTMEEEQKEANRRKVPIILFLIFIVALSLVGGTYAWFVNAQKKINNFTLGEVKHEIFYNFKELGAAEDFLPGEQINKDIWIHNAGKSDALLRVKVTPIWKEKDGSGTEVKNDDVILNFVSDLDTNWQKGMDGYYYYKKILKAHDGSEPHAENNKIDGTKIPSCYSNQLLDSIQLNNNITDQTAYANKTFDVIVMSETVQVNIDTCREQWDVGNDKVVESMLEKLVDNYKTDNGKIQ